MILWIRCGDADNYNDFGIDFAAAAEYLDLLGVTGSLVRYCKYGVSAPASRATITSASSGATRMPSLEGK